MNNVFELKKTIQHRLVFIFNKNNKLLILNIIKKKV